MAKEKNGILQGDELLWDVALRSIGIQLPDEYVLRFVILADKVKEVGLGNVSLSDIAEIEHGARHQMDARTKEGQGGYGGCDLSSEPVSAVVNEVDRIDTEEAVKRSKISANAQKVGYARRVANCCAAAGISSVSELVFFGYQRFLNQKNMGAACADTVKKALENLYGISTW